MDLKWAWSVEEQGKDETVQILEQGLSTPERVAAAVQCLPPYTAKSSPSDGGDEKSEPKFQYATIRDYAHAYSSGRVTPTQVDWSIFGKLDICWSSCKLWKTELQCSWSMWLVLPVGGTTVSGSGAGLPGDNTWVESFYFSRCSRCPCPSCCCNREIPTR